MSTLKQTGGVIQSIGYPVTVIKNSLPKQNFTVLAEVLNVKLL